MAESNGAGAEQNGAPSGSRAVWLWSSAAAVGTASFAATICARCGALVAVDHAVRHAGWHMRGEDGIDISPP